MPLCSHITAGQTSTQELQRSHDDCQHVVEVVGDAAGQLTHCVHLLTLTQSFLRERQLSGGILFGRDMSTCGVHHVVF